MSFQALEITCPEQFIEMLIAELAEVGFSTFQEHDDQTGFSAYADEGVTVLEALIKEIMLRYGLENTASYKLSQVEKENWNADWEKNYDPIIVAEKVLIRAAFHAPQPAFSYEIIVTPKMSFGTGHHETTQLLIEMMLSIDFEGKSVLDAGCGTGILAIFAGIRKASRIDAYDVDEWAVENSRENFGLNNIAKDTYTVWQGDVKTIPSASYDIIIANINRNILMEDISSLQRHMKVGSLLLLSGFYEHDSNDLLTEAGKFNLIEKDRSLKNKWVALCLVKN